jgi:outer membrane protein assembly factor BamE
MTQPRSPLYTRRLGGVITVACLLLTGCIYRIDIQQGNLISDESIEQVEVGMSRSAVRFLLGTPTVNDPFHDNRWDYPYYYKPGRVRESEAVRRWIIVYFDGDEVSRIEREVTLAPSS